MTRTRLARVGTLAFVIGALIMIVLHESIFRKNRFAAVTSPDVPARPVGGFVLLGVLVVLDLVLTTGSLWT